MMMIMMKTSTKSSSCHQLLSLTRRNMNCLHHSSYPSSSSGSIPIPISIPFPFPSSSHLCMKYMIILFDYRNVAYYVDVDSFAKIEDKLLYLCGTGKPLMEIAMENSTTVDIIIHLIYLYHFPSSPNPIHFRKWWFTVIITITITITINNINNHQQQHRLVVVDFVFFLFLFLYCCWLGCLWFLIFPMLNK